MGAADAVRGSAHDATGVASAFATGIEAGRTHRDAGLAVAQDGDWRAGAGFDGGENGFGVVVAADLSIE